MKAIKNGLGGLLRFSGRDRPGMFWPYGLAVFFLSIVMMMAVMVPAMMETFARFERFAAEHPELTTVERTPGGTSITIEGHHPELMPDVDAIFVGMGVAIAIVVILLAAAVVRRLHDSGRSGLWGLLPLPFLATGLILFPRLMADFTGSEEPNLGLFGLLMLNNLAYMAGLVTLVVLLILRGTAGPNRFGEPPSA